MALVRAQRGQALIVVVLIMFVLAGLGGVFIAMVNHSLVQAARMAERDQLEQIAQAGLSYAVQQITQSPDGAEWRPDMVVDPSVPADLGAGWKQFGASGFYKVTVAYGPQSDINTVAFGEKPLDRFLRIDVEARLKEPNANIARPYLTRKVAAYVPIGLPDYLVWITNTDNKPEPANLGANVLVADPLDATRGVSYSTVDPITSTTAPRIDPVPALTVYDGPVRSEVAVNLGSVRIDLLHSDVSSTDATGFEGRGYRVKRKDAVQVVGVVSSVGSGVARIIPNGGGRLLTDTGAIMPTAGTQREYVDTQSTNPLIRKMRAPDLAARDVTTSQHRYRALTRDSVPSPGSTTDVLGWGEGVYLNNARHIQYGHNLTDLQQEWLNPADDPATAWQDGLYRPAETGRAVKVILHDWQYDAGGGVTDVPRIELRRWDEPFVDKDGRPLTDQQSEAGYYYTFMPYPRNGVLFAEGNLVVTGNLPAALAFEQTESGGVHAPMLYQSVQDWGGHADPDSGVTRYYVHPYNRRFDLTIVSDGTIYIEGNLLTPATRRVQAKHMTGTEAIIAGSEYDTKLALLAMDNVCLNPTTLFAPDAAAETMGDERLWRVTHGRPLSLGFATAGPFSNETRFLLRHAGESTAFNAAALMRMKVNETPYRWAHENTAPDWGTRMLFAKDNVRTLLFPQVDDTAKAWQWSSTLYPGSLARQYVPVVSGSRSRADVMGFCDATQFGGTKLGAADIDLHGYGARNVAQFELLPESTADYLLAAGAVSKRAGPGFIVTPLDVQVDALIYAQRGSWFIIPGDYYNNIDPADEPAEAETWVWPFPKYREPLDVRIVVNGAIAQNRPAPPEAEAAWTARWRGADTAYIDTNGDMVPDKWDPGAATWDPATRRWTDRRTGIVYHYDATLARPVCFEFTPDGQRDYRPRLPKLPASPNVFSLEMMKGA